MDIYEEIRTKPIFELTKDEVRALSAFLNNQVPMDELTDQDKKFLSTPLATQCRECDKLYTIEPVRNLYGLCPSCMPESLEYGDNPFNKFGNVMKFIKIAAPVALIIYILISIFGDAPSSSSYTSPSSSSSSSSSSSDVKACISRSEKQFESCIFSIPGTASESDMNYCLDLHEARSYGCRTGRRK